MQLTRAIEKVQKMENVSEGIIQRVFKGDELADRFEKVYAKLDGADTESQEFEATVRENLVTCADRLDADQAKRLHEAVVRCAVLKKEAPSDLLPLFYADFDWLNRCEANQDTRMARWRELFNSFDNQLDEFSLYHYAHSRFLLAGKREAEAFDAARKAIELAPGNIGWLNNYSELLMTSLENDILSGTVEANSHTDDSNLENLLGRFQSFMADGKSIIYPSYLMNCGRIEACLGNREASSDYFEQAKARVMELHMEGHPRFGNESSYVAELGKIIRAQTVSELIQNTRIATASLRKMEEQQRATMEELDAKLGEVSDRLEGERVNMLEFLGFFSGIISFIIASITIGSEMDFVARGALIVVLLGALLLAFGSLGLVLEGLRPRPRTREDEVVRKTPTTILVWIGLAVIVFGFVFYLIAGPMLG